MNKNNADEKKNAENVEQRRLKLTRRPLAVLRVSSAIRAGMMDEPPTSGDVCDTFTLPQ